MKTEFDLELKNRFQALQQEDNVEGDWFRFKDTVNKAAESVLGRRRGKRKERWISPITWKIIDERRVLKAKKEQSLTEGKNTEATLKEYKEKDKEVKKCCKQDKQNWFDSKATEAEQAAQKGDTKTIYRLVKELSGCNSHCPMIKLADGQRATTHEQQANRWYQHFQKVLNCPEPDMTHDFDSEESDTLSLEICMDNITEKEVQQAVKRLKNGKAAGIDQIQLARTAKVLINHNPRAHKPVQQHTEEQNSAIRLAKWDYNPTAKER